MEVLKLPKFWNRRSIGESGDDDNDDDEHFCSLRTRFYKVIYIIDSLLL